MALEAAHALGVVHCDIKPSNMLLAADRTGRLADFGISRLAGATLDTFDSFRGSLRFVPPELLDGETPTAANDVYGLAMTLWASVTGEVPFGPISEPATHVMARIASDSLSFDRFAGDPDLPPETLELLDRALAKDPEDRPSMGEILETLRVATARPAPPTAVEVGAHPRSRRGSIGLAVLAVASVLGLSVAGAAIIDANRSPTPVVAKPAKDLCQIWRETLEARNSLYGQVSKELDFSTSPIDALTRLVNFPSKLPPTIMPLQAALAAPDDTSGPLLSSSQITDLTFVDSLRGLDPSRKPFLYDGQQGQYDAASLPDELREPASILSDIYTRAATRCPQVKVDVRESRARMNSAILAQLAQKDFMPKFFEDPKSYELFDARKLSLMFASSNDYIIALFNGHWDWFTTLMGRYDLIRTRITYERPDLFLVAVKSQPSLASTYRQQPWWSDLDDSIKKLRDTEKKGIEDNYGPQLAALGLSDAVR